MVTPIHACQNPSLLFQLLSDSWGLKETSERTRQAEGLAARTKTPSRGLLDLILHNIQEASKAATFSMLHTSGNALRRDLRIYPAVARPMLNAPAYHIITWLWAGSECPLSN